MFKREYFQIVDSPPTGPDVIRYRGWDTAATEGAGDWTAGTKISLCNGIYYIEDAYRVRVEDADVAIKQIALSDGREVSIREEKEGGASGKVVVSNRLKDLAGYDYYWVEISGNKPTRARPFRAQCEAGNVRLVRGDWNESYIREFEAFPVGEHDDFVDSTSCAFNALTLDPRKKKRTGLTWGG